LSGFIRRANSPFSLVLLQGQREFAMTSALNATYKLISANLAPKILERAIDFWLRVHTGADPQTGADHAPLRIVGEPTLRETGPMEYELTIRLRVDLRQRRTGRTRK